MPIRHAGDHNSFLDGLKAIFQYSLVHVFLATLFILGLLPFGFPINIGLFLIGLYYWSMYRPTILPFPLVLFYGILADSLYVNAIGFYTLIFLAIVGFIRWQRLRLANQIFIIHWGLFFILLTLIALLKFVVAYLFLGTSLNFIQSVQEVLIAGLVFPFVNMLLFYQNRLISSS
jgi:rod shape-determining protein MreD